MKLCELCGRDDEHPDDYGCTRRTVPPDGIVRTWVDDSVSPRLNAATLRVLIGRWVHTEGDTTTRGAGG